MQHKMEFAKKHDRAALIGRIWFSAVAAALITVLIPQGTGQRKESGDWQPRLAPTGGPAGLQEEAGESSADESAPANQNLRTGYLVQIELPITASVATQVQQVIKRHAESTPVEMLDSSQRAVIVLEFDTSNSRDGRGSDFSACLSLARLLTSADLNRIETVASVPAARGILLNGELDAILESRLVGHAVLVALACNHIVMDADSALGQAGIDEEYVDEIVVNAYEKIAAKRRAVPPEVAVALVDPKQSLVWVQREDDSIAFVDRQRALEMEKAGEVINSNTLAQPGALPLFSSELLARYQLIRLRTSSRRDIALRFNLDDDALEGDPSLGVGWKSVHLPLDVSIDQKTVSWILNALNQRVSGGTGDNLLIVTLDTDQVDPLEAMRLARHLAEYDAASTRTVAFVPVQATGAAAVLAFACDHLIMGRDAKLASTPQADVEMEPDEVAAQIKEIARLKDRDWSIPVAMIDNRLEVARYRHVSGQVRLLCEQEYSQLDDADQWTELDTFPTREISAGLAEQYFIARYLVDDFVQLKNYYQLPDEPALLRPTVTDRWLDGFASFLASPQIAFWLIFGAAMCFSAEMSQPGLGVPGFMGALLVLLFFWSQFLGGNVQMLEILLFIAGILCLLVELFLVPGLGVFGIGGAIMITLSLVLASQSFLWPTTPEEMKQMPYSMLTVFGGFLGFGVAVFLFRNYLHRMPILKRIMLEPSQGDELEEQSRREAIVDLQHLSGMSGTALTPLVPSGKARIGGPDC